jgi:acetolactate synthase-1/2/3 large subunit
MTASDFLVQCLENEGVRYVFGVPGEENEAVLFSLEDSDIQFVPTRHEQGAAFMANVWGRLTGHAGVCLSTLGPGATNLLTGIADANLDKAPLVAITAQGGITRLHHESHQYIDVVSMFRPVTKWNTAVAAPEIIGEVVRKAFKVSEAEKPGAAHIELSEDIAARGIDGVCLPLRAHKPRRPSADNWSIGKAVEMIAGSRFPLVLAGNGAVRRRASERLTALCRGLQIPVLATFMGKGAVSDELDQSLMVMGLGFRDFCMEAVDQADLIITVGYDIAEYAPENWNSGAEKRIIHIDFAPAEVYTHYNPELELVGDISGTLEELCEKLAAVRGPFDPAWYAPVRQRLLEDIAGYELKQGAGFTVPGVLNMVRRALPPEGLLISDVGSHKLWIARNFPTRCPNGCIISNGLASMGIALPGGVAAALVEPGRPVIAAMGDGGFLMNSQELETAKRLGVAFTCIVFNDNDYGLISWKQRQSRGRSVSTRIGNPDFKAYAESFGIRACRPSDGRELEQQLAESLGSGELRVIEIPIDPGVNIELVEKLKQHWRS